MADVSEDTRCLTMPVIPVVDPAHYWSGAQKEFPNMARLSTCNAVVTYSYLILGLAMIKCFGIVNCFKVNH